MPQCNGASLDACGHGSDERNSRRPTANPFAAGRHTSLSRYDLIPGRPALDRNAVSAWPPAGTCVPRRRPACGGRVPQARRRTTMRSRFFSTVFRPMPLTMASCSALLNGAVGLAIGDDGLGLARADVEQDAVDRGGVGGIDVDLLGGEGAAGEEQREHQGLQQGGELVHGMTP